MGRPARVHDKDLAEQIRSHLSERGLTLTEAATAIGVDKSTLSRSLKNSAFSHSLRGAVATLIRDDEGTTSAATLLHKSLHLLNLSDKMRQDAERMIAEALDRITKNE